LINAYALPNGSVAAEFKMDDGVEVQVVGLETTVLLGTRIPGGRWTVTPVSEPERFGRWQSLKAIRTWAQNFIDETREASAS